MKETKDATNTGRRFRFSNNKFMQISYKPAAT
jgi:hypothetical protein